MGEIIPFKNKNISRAELQLHIVDDYYIMIDELAELSDKSIKTVLKDIDKGILKADKINGDLLIPMDMAEEYINRSLNRKTVFIYSFFSVVILLALALVIGFIIIATHM